LILGCTHFLQYKGANKDYTKIATRMNNSKLLCKFQASDWRGQAKCVTVLASFQPCGVIFLSESGGEGEAQEQGDIKFLPQSN
jgi:hypothetical protein